MHLVNGTGSFIAMKGNIEEELTMSVKNKIERKYRIKKIEKFLLPYENSIRSLVVIEHNKS